MIGKLWSGIMERFKKNGMTPAEARLFLANVNENQRFFVTNGEQLTNVYELFDALNRMEHHEFDHHVTEHRNDFENWVRECVADEHLANKISSIKDKDEMTLHVGSRVRECLMTLKDE